MGKSTTTPQQNRENLLKRVLVSDTSVSGDGTIPDIAEFVEAFPVLNAFLTCTEIDGKTRQLPTITLWVEEYGIKAILNDRHANRKLWATEPSIGHVWAYLDEQLQSASCDWRSDQGTKKRR